MGRWAQRRVRGGGGRAENCARIVLVETSEGETIVVTFSRDVDVADFAASDFDTSPDGSGGTGIFQATSNSLGVSMSPPFGDPQSLVFGGGPSVSCGPQTVPIVFD